MKAQKLSGHGEAAFHWAPNGGLSQGWRCAGLTNTTLLYPNNPFLAGTNNLLPDAGVGAWAGALTPELRIVLSLLEAARSLGCLTQLPMTPTPAASNMALPSGVLTRARSTMHAILPALDLPAVEGATNRSYATGALILRSMRKSCDCDHQGLHHTGVTASPLSLSNHCGMTADRS